MHFRWTKGNRGSKRVQGHVSFTSFIHLFIPSSCIRLFVQKTKTKENLSLTEIHWQVREYRQQIERPGPNQAKDLGAIKSRKWNWHLCLLQVFWGLMGFLLTGLYPLWTRRSVTSGFLRHFQVVANKSSDNSCLSRSSWRIMDLAVWLVLLVC